MSENVLQINLPKSERALAAEKHGVAPSFWGSVADGEACQNQA